MRTSNYWLGVDVGGSSVKAGLWDGRKLVRVGRSDFGQILPDGEGIARRLQSMLQAWGNPSIRASAAGVPGLVSTNHRKIVESANLGWRNVPLASILSRSLGVLVSLDTDVLFAARAEAAMGAGTGIHDFTYINLGTGVSHVRVQNGQPQSGFSGLGMNLGHAPLMSKTMKGWARFCACGRPYCVERGIGGRAVARALRQLKGDELKRYWQSYGQSLGMVLSSVVSLLGTERIVLNGGVCAARQAFEASMRAAYESHLLHRGKLPMICFSRLGDHAGLFGAGLAAQNSDFYFSDVREKPKKQLQQR
jgi:glucokinase